MNKKNSTGFTESRKLLRLMAVAGILALAVSGGCNPTDKNIVTGEVSDDTVETNITPPDTSLSR